MSQLSNVVRKPLSFKWLFADRVVITLILALSTLAVVDVAQAERSIRFMVQALLHIAPYFILAILVAAYTKATGADQLISRAFSGSPTKTILAASLAGALSPFCSCGVIPLIAAMLAAGVPLAPVMAFCISSPIMDPEMFVLTAAGINLHFAVAKTIAALGMGLAAGFSVRALQGFGYLQQPLKNAPACGCCSGSGREDGPSPVQWKFWHQPQRSAQFKEVVLSTGGFLGKWMTLAFFIESIMIAYVPAQWIAGFVGHENALAIPISALIGVPAYMNGYAAIPLVSGLMEMGMGTGAALAFVTAGAVSSVPAALAVYALVKKSVFCLYLLLGFSGAIIAGYLFQLLSGIIF